MREKLVDDLGLNIYIYLLASQPAREAFVYGEGSVRTLAATPGFEYSPVALAAAAARSKFSSAGHGWGGAT